MYAICSRCGRKEHDTHLQTIDGKTVCDACAPETRRPTIDTTRPLELEITVAFARPITLESASIEFPGGLTGEEAKRIVALIEQIEADREDDRDAAYDR